MRGFHSFFALASACLLAGLAGCSTTRIASVWMDPEVHPKPFQKVLVVVMARDPDVRHLAEDTFVGSLPKKAQGLASYKLFPGDRMPELSEVRDKVHQEGADGVVVCRVVGVEKVESYTPGITATGPYPYYSTFGSYWGYAVPVTYDSGTIEDEIVRVESNAYSVADEALLWSAQSETLNPASIQILIDDVVVATMDRMRKDKILP